MAKAKSAMAHPLHLTADEKKLFDNLPAAVTKDLIVEEEKLTFYEPPDELKTRHEMFRASDPHYTELIQKLRTLQGKDVENVVTAIGALPEELLMNILFTIGATTLRDAIVFILPDAKTASDVEGIAALSMYRHALLEANLDTSDV